MKKQIVSVLAAMCLTAAVATPSFAEMTVSTDGSTSMEKVIGSLGEAFSNKYDDVTFTYNPTGSGSGITAAQEGRCDIGLSSRALKAEEAKTLNGTTLALDGIVVVVNPANKVSDLSIDQISKIFKGEVSSWKDVGGRAAKILAFQHELSRTQKALQTMIMHGQATISPLMEEYSDHFDSVQRQVAVYRNRPNALGYAFLWEANKLFPAGEIRFLKINGIAPTPENIRNGTYPLAFPIVMATRPSPDKEVGKLRDWICGPEGQELIERSGFLPLEKKAAAPEEGPLDLRTLPDIAAAPRPSLQKTLTAGI